MKARNTAKVTKVTKGKGSAPKASKASANARKGKAAAKVARKGKGKASVWQASETVLAHRAGAAAAKASLADNAKVSLVALDKFAPDSDVRKRFAKVRVGMSVADALAIAGGPTRYDMSCAIDKGRFAVKGKGSVAKPAKVASKAKPAKGKGK